MASKRFVVHEVRTGDPELDEHAPELVAELFRKMLEEARPDWSTVRLEFHEATKVGHTAIRYDVRLTAEGEARNGE